MWDVWFDDQIIFSNIEHLSNIDEIRNQGLDSRIEDMALLDEPNIELSAKVCARYRVFGL